MSGQWWESNLIVGPFSNITEANAWAAANPSSLFLGLLAIINGVPYSWSGSAWGKSSSRNALEKSNLTAIRRFGAGSKTTLQLSKTYGLQIPGPKSGYVGVYWVFENYDTTTSASVSIAKCASAPSNLNNGSALTPVHVLFAGSASGVIPAATTGSATEGNIPGRLVSDLCIIRSVARSDGGVLPLILLRCIYSTTAPKMAIPGGAMVGEEYGGGNYSGDLVTSWGSQTISDSGMVGNAYPIFVTAEGGLSAAGFGDSILQGYGSGNGYSGFVQRALAGLDIQYASYAEKGQLTVDTLAIIDDVLANSRAYPDVIFTKVWSPNDTYTWEAMVSDLALYQKKIYALKQKGIRVVVVSPIGSNQYNGDSANNSGKFNTLCKAIFKDYIDLYPALAVGGIGPGIRPEYSSDNLHLNAAGSDAATAVVSAWCSANLVA